MLAGSGLAALEGLGSVHQVLLLLTADGVMLIDLERFDDVEKVGVER
ncbi:hypothetical protein BH24GEM2_BH24GEM2_11190 [soil metagenome]